MPTKTRGAAPKTYQSTAYNSTSGATSVSNQTYCEGSAQQTTSEGHAYRSLGRSRGDIGGAFTSYKAEVSVGAPRMYEAYFNGKLTRNCFTIATGPVAASVSRAMVGAERGDMSCLNRSVLQAASGSTLDALGSGFVNQTKPTEPAVDLAVSMAEFLSEKKFFALPGKAGGVEGEYLNYMFGIAPTISDARDLRRAIADKDKILEQFRRDRGRQIRRQASRPMDTVMSSTVSTGVVPTFIGAVPHSSLMNSVGKLTTRTTKRTRAWFSGAYVYWYPDEGFGKTLAELDRLYGIKPGVNVAWELLPFSWLADYKFSMGDAISNMASWRDGLVMKYGYVMVETTTTIEETWEDTSPTPRAVSSATGFSRFTTKQRVPANPFGFGVKPGDLNARQKSILAALGISLVRNR